MLRSKGMCIHCFPGLLLLTRVVGKRLVFVTNNSTKSRADYKKKFDKLGVPVEVVSSLVYKR